MSRFASPTPAGLADGLGPELPYALRRYAPPFGSPAPAIGRDSAMTSLDDTPVVEMCKLECPAGKYELHSVNRTPTSPKFV
jgi:hypothetical protein